MKINLFVYMLLKSCRVNEIGCVRNVINLRIKFIGINNVFVIGLFGLNGLSVNLLMKLLIFFLWIL